MESWQLFNETILKNLSATQKNRTSGNKWNMILFNKDTHLYKKGEKATTAYL